MLGILSTACSLFCKKILESDIPTRSLYRNRPKFLFDFYIDGKKMLNCTSGLAKNIYLFRHRLSLD